MRDLRFEIHISLSPTSNIELKLNEYRVFTLY